MATDQDPSSENAGRYFLILLTMVPEVALTPEAIERHAAHLAELDRSGRLVLAGPIPERPGGLIVLRVGGLAEATAVAEEDPLVQGGYETYEVGTWLMSNQRNGYRPGPHRE